MRRLACLVLTLVRNFLLPAAPVSRLLSAPPASPQIQGKFEEGREDAIAHDGGASA